MPSSRKTVTSLLSEAGGGASGPRRRSTPSKGLFEALRVLGSAASGLASGESGGTVSIIVNRFCTLQRRFEGRLTKGKTRSRGEGANQDTPRHGGQAAGGQALPGGQELAVPGKARIGSWPQRHGVWRSIKRAEFASGMAGRALWSFNRPSGTHLLFVPVTPAFRFARLSAGKAPCRATYNRASGAGVKESCHRTSFLGALETRPPLRGLAQRFFLRSGGGLVDSGLARAYISERAASSGGWHQLHLLANT